MIRVATRGSPLALLQAEEVAAARLGEIGSKRLFGRELEQAWRTSQYAVS